MSSAKQEQLSAFVGSTFDSIWSLELLLHLRHHRERAWPHDELVGALRASDAVVSRSVATLGSAGLLLTDANGVRFAPANTELDALVTAVDALYATSPGAVRRMIITASHAGLTAFANAFRLRKD